MEEKRILLKMLRALLSDIQNIQQKGAGYYTCTPFVQRYNRLLEKGREIFKDETILLDTFEPIEDTKSVDPADKMKVTQRVLVEAGQLIALTEASIEEGGKSG